MWREETDMMIALISAVLGYGVMAGWTFHMAFKHTDHSSDESIADAIFWPIMFAPILVRVCANVYVPNMLEARRKRKERKALPPIMIRQGARIDTMSDYHRLKKLVGDFEIENGLDHLLEE
jgi:hypothetical protein